MWALPERARCGPMRGTDQSRTRACARRVPAVSGTEQSGRAQQEARPDRLSPWGGGWIPTHGCRGSAGAPILLAPLKPEALSVAEID